MLFMLLLFLFPIININKIKFDYIFLLFYIINKFIFDVRYYFLNY